MRFKHAFYDIFVFKDSSELWSSKSKKGKKVFVEILRAKNGCAKRELLNIDRLAIDLKEGYFYFIYKTKKDKVYDGLYSEEELYEEIYRHGLVILMPWYKGV